ncbi:MULTISPECIES: allophycocyanin subunit alpha-B [Fischerella]|uniref:Allophycocyanin n=1 Tax=Fischerella muscicola CCMEE 5323 TaxID=2019572 RepID=A0A2N6K630_FISMU|nr:MULTISPECIES: allophycocyanin subunit alpha-B [Fischerella]MBD2431594.1 allophycocyanin [Fischerella sp. FACHB-380]PLZ92234.1 allophycocyanin [Fischerella muscicola CCMEE 5323]
MSVVTELILNADSESRYPAPKELRIFQDFLKTGDQRIRIAKILSENEQLIVQRGSQKFWERCPNTPSNSGNERKTASCQRDQGWYVRLVTYSVLAGSEKPLEEIGTVGIKEMYNNLEIPLRNIVEAMRCIKEEAVSMMSEEDAVEVGPYFDYIIRALS